MRRRLRSLLRGPVLALCAWCFVTGCGEKPPPEVPRTLSGVKRAGRFVPPFAYEAVVRGELALDRGDFPAAVSAFELATAAPDEDPYVLSRLAFALSLSGDSRAAERALGHAEQIDPCSEAVWLTRGEIAERARNFEDAERFYVQAGECAKESDLGALGLARVLQNRGEKARALGVLTQWAHERGPRAAQAAFELALEQGDSVAMSHALDALLKTAPPRQDQLERATEKALELGRSTLAARLTTQAPSSFSKSLRARVQLATDNLEGARATLSATRPSELGGPLVAAELYLQTGLYEQAELAATDALSASESTEARLVRARARAALGRMDLATLDLEVVARDPGARTELRAFADALALGSVALVLQ